MTRPLLDEMLSPRIASQLRDRGHDMIAVVDVPALVSMPDADLLDTAAAQGRCLVTANVRDFTVLSAQWARLGKVHAGIVHVVASAFPQDRSFVGALVTCLYAAIADGQIPSGGREMFLRRG